MDNFQIFSDRFNQNNAIVPVLQSDIDKLENEFKIKFPDDYIGFMIRFGNVRTPDILNIILANDLDLDDIQQFWTINQIIEDKCIGRSSKPKTGLIPFASDCLGNIFGFLAADLQKGIQQCPVYFYDHDFDTMDKLVLSFSALIDQYVNIKI